MMTEYSFNHQFAYTCLTFILQSKMAKATTAKMATKAATNGRL